MNGRNDDDDNVIREGVPKTTFSPSSSSSLRFRFRSTSLPKSPSLDKMLLAEDEEDEEEENFASVAKFVEPPELPTLLIHKVFGKRYMMFVLF